MFSWRPVITARFLSRKRSLLLSPPDKTEVLPMVFVLDSSDGTCHPFFSCFTVDLIPRCCFLGFFRFLPLPFSLLHHLAVPNFPPAFHCSKLRSPFFTFFFSAYGFPLPRFFPFTFCAVVAPGSCRPPLPFVKSPFRLPALDAISFCLSSAVGPSPLSRVSHPYRKELPIAASCPVMYSALP